MALAVLMAAKAAHKALEVRVQAVRKLDHP
jgi:hypothetical protein